MAEFCAARPLAEVLAAFEEAQAAAAPIYDMADIAADPHYAARGSIVEVDGVPMQGLVARLSATPGAVRWAGGRWTPTSRSGSPRLTGCRRHADWTIRAAIRPSRPHLHRDVT